MPSKDATSQSTGGDPAALTSGANRSILHIRENTGLRSGVGGLPSGGADQAQSGCRKASKHGNARNLGVRIMNGVMNRQQTTNCQERLDNALTNGLNQESELRIGYRGGGNIRYPVKHNGTIWFYSEELRNRFWNAFGLNPDENAQNDIVVEINTPFDGINFRIGAGMFAFDEEDSLWLLHSGRIGGGRPGIGKEAFCEWYSQFSIMKDVEINEGAVKKGILVGNISDDSNFLYDLEAFIRKIRIFKQLTTDQTISSKRDALSSDLRKTGRKTSGPMRRTTTASIYERDPRIMELAKLMASGKFRLCKKKGPFTDKLLDLPFLETHHVEWLSEGGRDSIDNTVALCPNCHRKMHHIADKKDIAKLRAIAKEQAKLLC